MIWGNLMLSSSLEKYLVCIYTHLENKTELKVSDLSREMNQPLSKTIQALQRMHYQKQIIYSTYQPLRITEQGKKMAQYLIARDSLIDEFFKLLHIEEHAELEKEAIAQYLSYDSLKKIERFVLFNRKYPEIAERFELLLQINLEKKLLPEMPIGEK